MAHWLWALTVETLNYFMKGHTTSQNLVSGPRARKKRPPRRPLVLASVYARAYGSSLVRIVVSYPNPPLVGLKWGLGSRLRGSPTLLSASTQSGSEAAALERKQVLTWVSLLIRIAHAQSACYRTWNSVVVKFVEYASDWGIRKDIWWSIGVGSKLEV